MADISQQMKNNSGKRRLSLNKYERVKRSKDIDYLFSEGEKLFEYPLLIWWQPKSLPTKYPAQVLVSVSKKRFKRAVDRIRIKRLLREALPQNKQPLYEKLEENQQQMLLSVVYVGKKMPSYQEIEKKIIILLHRILQVYESGKNHTK
ncbi:MAG: ribonuclease P protein component [Bacteroidales bacterium]|nr:ribonuclease P protein component [Bacteroidales bacterium]